MIQTPPKEIGESVPASTPHAVSVSLPSWKATIAYEEGESWIVNKMKTGYPRFFVHRIIQALSAALEQQYGRSGEKSFIYPSYASAVRCRDFMQRMAAKDNMTIGGRIRVLQLVVKEDQDQAQEAEAKKKDPGLAEKLGPGHRAHISVVFFPSGAYKLAKQYWQHSGEGVSSRLAEFCLKNLVKAGTVEPAGDQDQDQFVEERYGRNLNGSLAQEAKRALKRRIANSIPDVVEDLVYLYPTGMAAIFAGHRLVRSVLGDNMSVCFGFPYVDTLNLLNKFGKGMWFYGNGESEDLEDLEKRLEKGSDKILMLHAEFSSNPMLKTPDLKRIRRLADKYGFAVVVDDTLANFSNANVLPYCDVVFTSLTKVFSGECNVMGGSLVLNPKSRYFEALHKVQQETYEDIFWDGDAIFLERNSRDFKRRSAIINSNAEMVVDLLLAHPKVKSVFYPTLSPTRKFYDDFKLADGGYGGLLSMVFHDPMDAEVFFDEIEAAKGPSLGTNFTLLCPYAILAHYGELDYVEQFGVVRSLVRVSVGMEDTADLKRVFKAALSKIE